MRWSTTETSRVGGLDPTRIIETIKSILAVLPCADIEWSSFVPIRLSSRVLKLRPGYWHLLQVGAEEKYALSFMLCLGGYRSNERGVSRL